MFEQLAQRTYDAVKRKDVAAVMRGWADDGVLEFPGRSTLSGRYEGGQAVEGFFRRWFDRMETIRLTVRHVGFDSPALTLRGTMYIEFESEQKTTDGFSFRTQAVGMCRMRRGKVTYYCEYVLDPEPVEVAWGLRGD